ncbi:MAG: ATP-binding cassette domain-containing protein, partial [Desulfobacteraceae bacterium]
MNDPQNDAVLSVENISVGYGNGSILKNIHAEFARNKVTALMGPSGCGKSTFLRVLNRTLELIPGAVIKTGKVYYHGRDIYSPDMDAQSVRTRIGIVQQRPLPFPMSIRENVLFGARFHNKVNKHNRKEFVRQLLEKTGLWEEVAERLDSSAGGLSI